MASKSTEEKIRDKLVESGEYERLKGLLRQKLLDCGWFDDVNELALEQLGGLEDPNFEVISQSIEPRALDMVPDDVKVELLENIKSFLGGIVEKAP